ncbi:MAG: hypothetical protein O3C40_37375, partial [Planctomycetota bacterium]|nr:hypothetical protein [Planctomycetota bacterium]
MSFFQPPIPARPNPRDEKASYSSVARLAGVSDATFDRPTGNTALEPNTEPPITSRLLLELKSEQIGVL